MPRVLVIGLGLIGASFAKAIKQNGLAFVQGYDLNAESMTKALQLGIIDEACVDLQKAAAQADIIQLAIPVLAVSSVLNTLAEHISANCILTDVGSVKAPFIAACEQAQVKCKVVPGHPIAGAEKSGVEAANAELFVNHQIILTPVADDPESYQQVAQLWQGIGGNVVSMTVDYHDEVLAATSHLPHLVAFSLVDTLNKQSENRDIFNYAAGGFRDFTRIAASDPVMWRDICLANKQALLSILAAFVDDLQQLKQAIESEDGETLTTVFGQAKEAREHFSEILKLRQQK